MSVNIESVGDASLEFTAEWFTAEDELATPEESYQEFQDWFAQGTYEDKYHAAQYFKNNGYLKLYIWTQE